MKVVFGKTYTITQKEIYWVVNVVSFDCGRYKGTIINTNDSYGPRVASFYPPGDVANTTWKEYPIGSNESCGCSRTNLVIT